MAHRLRILLVFLIQKNKHLSFRAIPEIQGDTSFGCLEGHSYTLLLNIRDTDAEGFVKGMERKLDCLDKISNKSESLPLAPTALGLCKVHLELELSVV